MKSNQYVKRDIYLLCTFFALSLFLYFTSVCALNFHFVPSKEWVVGINNLSIIFGYAFAVIVFEILFIVAIDFQKEKVDKLIHAFIGVFPASLAACFTYMIVKSFILAGLPFLFHAFSSSSKLTETYIVSDIDYRRNSIFISIDRGAGVSTEVKYRRDGSMKNTRKGDEIVAAVISSSFGNRILNVEYRRNKKNEISFGVE